MKYSIRYAISVLVIIMLGLMSRSMQGIPVVVGDMLYATMIYFFLRFFSISKAFVYSIMICYCIEFLQLVDYSVLQWLRNNAFTRLIFGQGFQWQDLIAYLIGSSIGCLIDKFVMKKI